MTENDLIDLGFTKIEYTKKDLEELGDSSDPYRYYSLEIYKDENDLDDESPFVLETQATFDMNTDEIEGDGWEVELFDTGLFRWYKKEDVKTEKYGRLLADVIINNISVGPWLLQQNLAVKYEGKTKVATRSLLEKVDRIEFDAY